MKTKFFGKFGNIIRRAFCGMLCLVVVFQSIHFASAISESFESYKWTRINSYNDLITYVEETSKTDRDLVTRGLFDDSNKVLNDSTGWFKALIAYESNGQYYFLSGQSSCNDGQAISASPVLDTYGMDFSKNSFTTRSGYYTPYIKFAGWDSDNPGHPRFYIRCSNTRDENLSNTIIVGNSSWYGIAHHAACAEQLIMTSVSSPSGHDFGRACNWSIDIPVNFVMGSGFFKAYYNVDGAIDRAWTTNGNVLDAAICSGSNFILYIGTYMGSSGTAGEIVAQAGITSTYCDVILKNDAQLKVPKNCYMVIDGDANINTGTIVVDGGMLVIRGLIDSKGIENPKGNEGSITVQNGGTLIIEENGAVVSRFTQSQLLIQGGSTVVISGSYVTAGKVNVGSSSLFVREGGALFCGVSINESCDVTKITKSNLYSARNTYLSSFATETSGSDFKVYDNAYYENNGLFYLSKYSTVTLGDGVKADYTLHNNIEAKLGAMMTNW